MWAYWCRASDISYDIIAFKMKLAKRIARLRNARWSVSPDELDSILLAVGFTRAAGKGDHRHYRHADLTFTLVIDPRRLLLAAYLKAALTAIDEVWQP